MHRKKRSLLLSSTFLISFVAVVFYFRFHLHSTFSVATAPNHLVSTPSSPTFSFTIKLLAFDRIHSIRRCLRSLARADYGGDRVGLHVFVDHLRDVNGSDLVDRKLEESRRILEFVDGFRWEHGEKIVHYRTKNVGLQAQWLEAWWPVSDDDFAFVVEDDLEVSVLYYRFLKGLIGKYYYDKKNFSPYIYGASLQRPRFVPGKHGNKLQLDGDTHLFLYQLVGTWGQLLFPKPWKEFRLWYDINKSKGIKPILQGMVTNGWYKKMGEKIWTPWFIKFIHSRDYYNIYTSFKGERALSISHRDAGVNYGKSIGPDSSLIDERSLDFNLWVLQPLMVLKWFNFCFEQMHPAKFAESFDELDSLFNSLQKKKAIVLFSLYQTAEHLIQNLLCHLERVYIQNYIFIGVNYELLKDLARRGHHVIYSTRFAHNLRKDKLSGFHHSGVELTNEVLVKSYVIKKCLEHGYNTWMIDGNMIPVTDVFSQFPDISHDFIAEKDADILFARSSQSALNIWSDDFIYKVASAANSLANGRSDSLDQRYFVHLIARILKEGRYASRIGDGLLDFGAKLGAGPANSSLENDTKIVFWHPEMDVDIVRRELGNAGLWLTDGDSCSAVYCHQS